MDTTKLFQERLHRYVAANYNYRPDRIPIRLFSEEFSAKFAGKTNFDAAVDHLLQFDVNRKTAVDLGLDAIQVNSIVNWMGMMKAIGWKGIVFPGIGLPMNSCTQWTEPSDEESAFLKADEYDMFSQDPTRFLLEKWLPRFTDHIVSPGEAVTFNHNMSLINGVLAYDMLFTTWGAKTAELIEAGVVPAISSVLKAPLDIIGDKLRGYINLVYDLTDRREKVVQACEALMPHLYQVVAGGMDPDRNIPSIIFMHRGSVPFITHDDFNEIYWPTLKPIIQELWSHGQQLILYAEGNWDEHLEAFAELPERSVIFHLDKTDIFKAHKILGGKFALSGGVPNELLRIGTPEQVRGCCKKIIKEVASEGGYIMDASALIMDDAKIENVRAMVDYTLEHGVYSRGSDAPATLEKIKSIDRPDSGYPFKQSSRPPGVCVPWTEKKQELPEITGNPDQARTTWESIDILGYTFLWVNLTW